MNVFNTADEFGLKITAPSKISSPYVFGFQQAEMLKSEVYTGERYPVGTNPDSYFRANNIAPIGIAKQSSHSIRQSLPLIKRNATPIVNPAIFREPIIGPVFKENKMFKLPPTPFELVPNSVLDGYMDVNKDGSIRKSVNVKVQNDNQSILREYTDRINKAKIVSQRDMNAAMDMKKNADLFLLHSSPELYRTLVGGANQDQKEQPEQPEQKEQKEEKEEKEQEFLDRRKRELEAELRTIKRDVNAPNLINVWENKGRQSADDVAREFLDGKRSADEIKAVKVQQELIDFLEQKADEQKEPKEEEEVVAEEIEMTSDKPATERLDEVFEQIEAAKTTEEKNNLVEQAAKIIEEVRGRLTGEDLVKYRNLLSKIFSELNTPEENTPEEKKEDEEINKIVEELNKINRKNVSLRKLQIASAMISEIKDRISTEDFNMLNELRKEKVELLNDKRVDKSIVVNDFVSSIENGETYDLTNEVYKTLSTRGFAKLITLLPPDMDRNQIVKFYIYTRILKRGYKITPEIIEQVNLELKNITNRNRASDFLKQFPKK